MNKTPNISYQEFNESRRIKLVNHISVISCVSICIFIAFYLGMDIPDLNTQIIYLSFFAAGALLPILFNRIQLHQLAKLYIAAYDTTLILILLAKFGGKAHGSHILFLLFAIIPIFIWSIKERIFIFIFYGLNIGLFLAYEFFNFPLLGQVALPESYFEVTKGITILISYTGATIAIIIFHRLSNIKEEQLQLQNQEIGRQKVELEKLNNKLNEKLQELTQQKNELKQANRIQSKIHSVIAHDLRSPVSSIYRLLEVINTDLTV
jgi:signal transduction histidine kinase